MLKDWRKQIDALDEELLKILAKRMDVVRKIGAYKKERGIAPLDEERWQEVLRSRVLYAQKPNLSEDFIKTLFELIHQYALKIEEDKNV